MLLSFLVKLIAGSGLLYGYYHLFLRNRQFHHYNRFYLLAAVLVSMILPFIHIPASLLLGNHQHGTVIQTLRVINVNGWEEPVTIYASSGGWGQWLTIQNCLFVVYFGGLLTGLVMLIRSLAWIKKLRRKYPYDTVDQLRLYYTAEPGTPFSFFRSVFWDNNISLHDARGQQIFRHEMFHVKEKHSADVLLMELICCCCWFNPFYHLLKKELKAIHEFLADEYAASANNRYEYAELLVAHAITQKKLSLTTPFFHNQLKRRITMITQSNLIRRSGYIRRIMALPLLLLLFSAFAVKLSKTIPGQTALQATARKITVVVDPGHGGMYPGAKGIKAVEKDLTLAISQKIKELAVSYNINVVLTRNEDKMVAGASDLKQDLQNRINITNTTKPDLFLSIHVNFTPHNNTSLTGFQAYIGTKNNDARNRQLSSAILNSLKHIYKVDDIIKQHQSGVFVLDNNNYPSAIIECGFLNNPNDEAYFSEPVNQEKVAHKILEGIVQYTAAQNTTSTTLQYQPVADTLTEQVLAVISEVDIQSIDTDLHTKIATVHFKNGDVKYAHAALIDKYFPPHITTDTIPGVHKSTVDTQAIFKKVEFEPDYTGGEKAWVAYLIKNVHYPKDAVTKKLEGTVVVEFIVDTNGKISDVKAISGPTVFREESIRVVKESGTWVPAKQNGKTVRAYKRQPIVYRIG